MYIKFISTFGLLLMLSACGTWRDNSGNGLSVQDDFQCKQQCGYYDTRQNIFGSAQCMAHCYQSKGYSVQKD